MRRARCVRWVALALAGAAAVAGPVLTPAPATAHPLGNFTVNRASALEVTAGSIRIAYALDLAEIPTFQALPSIDTDGDGTASHPELERWAAGTARRIAGALSLSADGRPVRLRVVSATARLLPGQAGLHTLRLDALLAGSLQLPATVAYTDRNDPGRVGWREVTVRAGPGAVVVGSTVPSSSPSRGLRAYPPALLSSPLRVTEARFTARPGQGDPPSEPGSSGASGSPGTGAVGSLPGAGGRFAALVGWRLTVPALLASLLLAFAFGAIHALGPGHGKAVTAAYLTGTEARVRQAVGAGAAVALMHTASTLTLGFVLFVLARSFPADRIYPWLTLATGAVAVGLGTTMLCGRLRGRGGESAHAHPHPDHPHPHEGPPPVSLRGLGALAVAGGILPSPSAFLVLTAAVATHRVGYGLALVFAFSLGLAASLSAVGLLAVRARQAVVHPRARLARLVPLGSALVVVAAGLILAGRGVAQLG